MNQYRHTRPTRSRAFTLAELVVVMGIVAIVATITVIAVARITQTSRLATARNAVVASLETARSHAMANNRLVLVVFPVRYDPNDPERPQQTEIIIAEWLGQTVPTPYGGGRIKDRFVPVTSIARRQLPAGIKVAGPWYDLGSESDEVYRTQPEFKAILNDGEIDDEGRLIGIVYGPSGEIRTQTSESGADDIFVDFNLDGEQDCLGCSSEGDVWQYSNWNIDGETGNTENNIELMPFIAVYDDAAAREALEPPFNVASYAQLVGNTTTLPGGWIGRNADRIHFNRYSGAVMR